MDTIPYEIIQLIADNLLPHHQCRFALTSRHHYKYLYTDLLQWHAKWRLIALPKCTYACTNLYNISVTRIGKKITMSEITDIRSRYEIVGGLFIINLSNMRKTYELANRIPRIQYHQRVPIWEMLITYRIIKNILKKISPVCSCTPHPVLSLPDNVLRNIILMSGFDRNSFNNLVQSARCPNWDTKITR